MKYKTLLFLFLIVYLSGCEETSLPNTAYPIMIMEKVEIIEKGVVFHAKVKNQGVQNIQSYGFVWSKWQDPTIVNNSYSEIQGSLTNKEFSDTIESGFEVIKLYYVRAFAKTDNITYYGTEKQFTSQGIRRPEIVDFQPKKGKPRTIVTISGKYFGYQSSEPTVYFGQEPATVVENSKDTIRVISPVLNSANEQIIVNLDGQADSSENKFSTISPWKIKSEHLPVNTGLQGTSVSHNETAYYLPGNPNTVWSYSYNSNSWDFIGQFPGSNRNNAVGFASSSEVFFGLGYSSDNLYSDLWAYSTQTKTWSEKAEYPGSKKLELKGSFRVDKEQFFYFNSYSEFEFWSYGMENDRWKRIVLEDPISNVRFGFTHEDNGYLVSENGQIWQLDIENSTFTKTGTFSSRIENNLGFCLQGVVYSYDYDKFNCYDLKWKDQYEISNPVSSVTFHFEIDNKAFFYNDYSKIFWEFSL